MSTPFASRLTALLVFITTGIYGCDKREPTATDQVSVLTTTTMLADMAQQIGGERVVATSIVSPGGDPHLYQPTPQDARDVARADIVIRNGLTLEGWIDDLVANAGGQRPVITASEGVVGLDGSTGGTAYDPHFWFDLELWANAAEVVSRGLIDVVDESLRGELLANTRAYRGRVLAMDAHIAERVATIPDANRVLVTSHDAFSYFGRRYGLRVVGIQGISTEEEASQRDLANVIDIVRETGVPAVFVESSVNPRMIEQVVRETGVNKAGPLYSDSTGPVGSNAETLLGMMAANAEMIVTELGGVWVEPPSEAQ